MVSGKNGQLGSELQLLAPSFSKMNLVFAGKEELNLADEYSVEVFFQNHKPAFFINCAAYTAVDKADTEKELAFKINAEAVGAIAKHCAAHHPYFVGLQPIREQFCKNYAAPDEGAPRNKRG